MTSRFKQKNEALFNFRLMNLPFPVWYGVLEGVECGVGGVTVTKKETRVEYVVVSVSVRVHVVVYV